MKLTMTVLLLALGLLTSGCVQRSGSGASALSNETSDGTLAETVELDADEGEVEVPLDQVPEAVKAAALAAMPGIVFSEAEREMENGVLVYELKGTVDGKEYEIEVSADGKVIEIEEEDGDDDGDDDDGDGDDDDD